MALNFSSNSAEKMYEIVIEGHKWSLDETNTQRIIDILNGMVSSSSKASKPVAVTAPTTPYVYKDTDPKWEIKKIGNIYTIRTGIYSKLRSARNVANSYIKALDNIQTIEVEMTGDKAGQSYKAWGYKTKSAAEKAIKSLPKILKAEEINTEAENLRSRR